MILSYKRLAKRGSLQYNKRSKEKRSRVSGLEALLAKGLARKI
jgi:hypothetical protein